MNVIWKYVFDINDQNTNWNIECVFQSATNHLPETQLDSGQRLCLQSENVHKLDVNLHAEIWYSFESMPCSVAHFAGIVVDWPTSNTTAIDENWTSNWGTLDVWLAARCTGHNASFLFIKSTLIELRKLQAN